MALMAQRQFWNGLLRDAILFKDVQVSTLEVKNVEPHAVVMGILLCGQ